MYIDEHLENGGRKASWLGAIEGYKPEEHAKITFGKLKYQIAYDDKVLLKEEVRKVAHALRARAFRG